MPRVMRDMGHNLEKLSGEFCFHKRGCYDHGCDHFSPRKAIYGDVTAVSVSHYRSDKSVSLPSWTCDSFLQSCVCLQGRKCPFFSAEQSRRECRLQLSLAQVKREEKQCADTHLWYFFAHILRSKFICFNEPRLHFCPTLCFCFVLFFTSYRNKYRTVDCSDRFVFFKKNPQIN